jgi:predicted ribosomally synthesized peptide with SipW-like signal peptide
MGGTGPDGWIVISVFTAAIAVVVTLAALTARETAKTPTAELGRR